MKLEAKDLRIGNYVQLGYDIEEIDIYLLKALIDGDDFKPIPLTIEWLEKLGFEKETEIIDGVENYDYYLGFLFGFCLLCEWKDDGELDYVCVEDYGLEIRTVHQLQNLYHALTGQELTIKK